MENRDYRKTLVDLFEEQVKKTPEQIALTHYKNEITYYELDERANRIADYLILQGVKQGDIIAVVIDKSIAFVETIIGIMKCKAIYLPLDTEYPLDFLTKALEGIHTVITKDKHINVLDNDKKVIIYNDIFKNNINGKNTNRRPLVLESDIAYMIYTSGSSGSHKGVLIRHESIANMVIWRRAYYGFSDKDVVLQIPPISFDSSVSDIFTALSSGSRLVLINKQDLLQKNKFNDIMSREKITHFLSIPSLYDTFLTGIKGIENKLRIVTVAGESFSKKLVDKHFHTLPNTKLINEYGPTECSVCATFCEIKKEEKIYIGKPIPGINYIILCDDGSQATIGQTGELLLSGIGLADGYAFDEQMTEKQFPIINNVRYYRTGDVVKLNENGLLEFIGRVDNQIKVRGHRIEIEQIEKSILENEFVERTVVVYVLDQIHCFYESERNCTDDIARYLKNKLPVYMIPNVFHQEQHITLLPNNKVDRQYYKNKILNNTLDNNSTKSEETSLLDKCIHKVVPQIKFDYKKTLRENGVDSIKQIVLMSEIEESYQIEIEYDDLIKIVNSPLSYLVDFLQKIK